MEYTNMDSSTMFTIFNEDYTFSIDEFSYPLEIQNTSWEEGYLDLVPTPFLSISKEEEKTDPRVLCPSRKSSLDLSSFIPPDMESPVNNMPPTSEEIPSLELTACAMKKEKSLTDLLQEETCRLHAAECKKRRMIRMEILKKKRQQGTIMFGSTIRYQERSNLAIKRVRSCGKFVTEYNYINV